MAEPRSDDFWLSELARVAPGTDLREGLEYILSGRTGALIVIGDKEQVVEICNGGFELDIPFTPQRLFELAKMDGAIILDAASMSIRRANVHLVPDPELPTSETGMRHRTAERVSRQTTGLVISISQRRDVVSLYLGGEKLILDDIDVVLAKASQALQTLDRYRARLERVLERLTDLEFDDIVTLGDITEAVATFEMVKRVSREVSRYVAALGSEGRLVRMQAEELTLNVDEDYLLVVRDYAGDPGPRKAAATRAALGRLSSDQLLEPEVIAGVLGMPSDRQSAEDHVTPRGYRVLRRVPLLPTSVISRLVERFGTLSRIAAATVEELDDVDGVGSRRARAIREGVTRMRARAAR